MLHPLDERGRACEVEKSERFQRVSVHIDIYPPASAPRLIKFSNPLKPSRPSLRNPYFLDLLYNDPFFLQLFNNFKHYMSRRPIIIIPCDQYVYIFELVLSPAVPPAETHLEHFISALKQVTDRLLNQVPELLGLFTGYRRAPLYFIEERQYTLLFITQCVHMTG